MMEEKKAENSCPKCVLLEAVEEWGITEEKLKEIAELKTELEWVGFLDYNDALAFYHEYEDLIWETLKDEAKERGLTIMQLLYRLWGASDVEDSTTFYSHLAWYALQFAAHHVPDREEH
jgi:hypothetical protein